MSPVAWDDEVDAVLAGDLTAALGYRTPAGGVVVQAVAPIGMRDRETGTIGFTTSLGFSRKLERIVDQPTAEQRQRVRELSTAQLSPPADGPFWNRWLREYHRARTGPRVDVARARRRLSKTPHHLAGFAGADGRPVVVPVTIGAATDGGLELISPMLAPGAYSRFAPAMRKSAVRQPGTRSSS